MNTAQNIVIKENELVVSVSQHGIIRISQRELGEKASSILLTKEEFEAIVKAIA